MDSVVRKEINEMEKYIGGKPISEVKREFNIEEVVKMASNENPLGCSNNVKAVIKTLVDDTSYYPDGGNYNLRNLLSENLNVNGENIILGAGSSSLIKVISNTLISENDESIMGEITFSLYENFTKLMGGKPVKVPMKELALDLDGFLKSITNKTKIIWLTNPNNPTGTAFDRNSLEDFLNKVPKNIYVVIDEAYREYATMENYPDGLEFAKKMDNVIVLRTFSKAYGIASLRVGYGICKKELAEFFNRVINPFEVNLYAQSAAVEALKDQEFVKYTVQYNKKQREFFYEKLDGIGLKYIKSESNFILIDVKGKDEEINQYLLKHGFIVRPGYLLDCYGYIRVTIGLKEQNERLIELIEKFFAN
ncbi:MAG: histidinol-phosphate transaminase [Sarcina sp.]